MSAAAPAAAAQPPTQTDTDTVTEAHTDQPSNIDSTNVTSSDEMELPSHNSTYKRKEYWEERFSKEEKYEWLSGQTEATTKTGREREARPSKIKSIKD